MVKDAFDIAEELASAIPTYRKWEKVSEHKPVAPKKAAPAELVIPKIERICGTCEKYIANANYCRVPFEPQFREISRVTKGCSYWKR